MVLPSPFLILWSPTFGGGSRSDETRGKLRGVIACTSKNKQYLGINFFHAVACLTDGLDAEMFCSFCWVLFINKQMMLWSTLCTVLKREWMTVMLISSYCHSHKKVSVVETEVIMGCLSSSPPPPPAPSAAHPLPLEKKWRIDLMLLEKLYFLAL